MAAPQTPYEAVLHAARDVAKLDCALDAEMLGTALLGSVYAVAEDGPRRRPSATSSASSSPPPPGGAPPRRPRSATVFAVAGAGRRRRRRGQARRRRRRPGRRSSAGSGRPAATRTATCTATRRPTWPRSPTTTTQAGGPEHAVVALVDHNIGITKDVFVGGPAERILGQVREMCADRRADLVPRGGPGAGCAARSPGTWDHRRAGRPARRGLAGHRPRAGRAPGWPCCRRRRSRRWPSRPSRWPRPRTRCSATSWPPRRRPAFGLDQVPPTTSWRRCTSA